MNFLAHAYLSFNDPGILAGNMISDFVKGKKKFDYPDPIRQGIELHREIDAFTDAHPATRAAATFFRKDYRLYAPAFIDIVYDHFLANDAAVFHTEQHLHRFSGDTYQLLEPASPYFPQHFQRMFPYMKAQNWLYNYRFEEGIRNSFEGLVRRAAHLEDARPAFEVLMRHYEALSACYQEFFPQLQQYVQQRFELMNKRF
ncbi:ACP phosphodiesterase [Parasegetibacter sp. NRK P23]|uniref:acyl carrier protein phosphodiesterase n=1 Tax=Parasegetibacter sp. NRK P23 TaxID=2942999 RepID=UPI0020448303|nr:ACP phosphodiesterase [Parasegetibacter sp. NRK P23]MCM5527958.1 ACP phosphodiesterase [Parasegetibacter sp. NRK P23]